MNKPISLVVLVGRSQALPLSPRHSDTVPDRLLCPTHELTRYVAVRESEGDKGVMNATSGTRELLHRFSVQLLTDEGIV